MGYLPQIAPVGSGTSRANPNRSCAQATTQIVKSKGVFQPSKPMIFIAAKKAKKVAIGKPKKFRVAA
jgi:hypothetical protein